MQWLSNFNQSLYYTRLAYPQNFIIFGSQKLKIWFKQVCMHSKTHLKFQFNSSINSTTSAHIIFFLNTTLHYESNKIGIIVFGSTHLKIQKSQISIQNWYFWTSPMNNSHCRVGPGCQLTPPVSDSKIGETHVMARRRWNSPTVTPPVNWTAPAWSPWWGGSMGATIVT